MQANWREIAAKCLIGFLSWIPETVYTHISKAGAKLLDRKAGHIAKASIKIALPHAEEQEVGAIARDSARYSLAYILLLPKLKDIPYQLHNLAAVQEASAEERGVIVISLHTGPPDIGTLAFTQAGISATTVIGAGKQSPWINRLGRHALNKAGISFIQRGEATGVIQAVNKKQAVFLYSDMRSREMEVTFFGQQTSAPASGIYTALLTRSPILFHYCTLQDGEWQLHFERFEIEQKKNRKASVQHNLQRLIHKMESAIRKHPALWIWHYDRFKLKKSLLKK